MHAVVLCAAGDKASAPVSTCEERGRGSMDDWDFEDVAVSIGPKHNQVWKPVVTAVHGSCCAGAMYFLNESDIVIASEEAMFFDSHVSYECVRVRSDRHAHVRACTRALRWLLLDLEERMSAHERCKSALSARSCPRRPAAACARLAAIIAANRPTAFREASRPSGMACGRSSPTLIGGGSVHSHGRQPSPTYRWSTDVHATAVEAAVTERCSSKLGSTWPPRHRIASDET